MIHSVKIPTGVSRMGCTPGGGCCSACGGHKTGPPIGPSATHIHALMGTGAQSGRRNAALHSGLGDTPDITDTIYAPIDTGIAPLPVDSGEAAAVAAWADSTAAQISNDALNALGLNSATVGTITPAPSSINPWWFIGGGLLMLLLLESGNKAPHRVVERKR